MNSKFASLSKIGSSNYHDTLSKEIKHFSEERILETILMNEN